MMHTELGP